MHRWRGSFLSLTSSILQMQEDKSAVAGTYAKLRGAKVSLRSLTKYYDDVCALDNATVVINAGEFVTLLGPSGSGKSTALQMIAGFTVPTAGDILFDDVSVVALPTYKRNVGMVFQHYSLFPHMDVFGNVAFPLEMRRLKRTEIQQRVTSALRLVRLPGFEDRRIDQLSGGQQQRVALARALVYEPALLLLDEPLGALDLKLRQELQIELLHLHERLGLTVIFVTHDQGEALTMSSRIIVMKNGTIQQVGTPTELYKRPGNRFVADFVGETNVLEGEIAESIGGRQVAATPDGLSFSYISQDGHETGQSVTAVVRPESILINPSPDELHNTYEGMVTETIYLGDVVKSVVQIGEETTVTAKTLFRATAVQLAKGDRVRVGWSAEDMVPVDSRKEEGGFQD